MSLAKRDGYSASPYILGLLSISGTMVVVLIVFGNWIQQGKLNFLSSSGTTAVVLIVSGNWIWRGLSYTPTCYIIVSSLISLSYPYS
jgi:ABC-type Fe3+-siderophore transport system permease subunit